MVAAPAINLLKRTARLSPEVLVWEKRLKKFTLIIWGTSLVLGLVVLSAYLFLWQQQKSLEATEKRLTNEISLQKEKEGLYLVLQSRLDLIDKIRTSSTPWDKLTVAFETLGVPPTLKAITTDEKNQITISLQSGSLDEISNIIRATTVLVSQKLIRNPQIVSFSIDVDGLAKLVLGFESTL